MRKNDGLRNIPIYVGGAKSGSGFCGSVSYEKVANKLLARLTTTFILAGYQTECLDKLTTVNRQLEQSVRTPLNVVVSNCQRRH